MSPSSEARPRARARRPKRRYGTVHGAQGRGLQYWPEAPLYQGRFGRLFGELPALELSEAEAADVAARMVEPAAEPAAEDNPAIPAGYTYLGQFIDHDITFDPASSLQKRNDPEALVNFRTPASTSTRSTAAGRTTTRTCTTGPTGARGASCSVAGSAATSSTCRATRRRTSSPTRTPTSSRAR